MRLRRNLNCRPRRPTLNLSPKPTPNPRFEARPRAISATAPRPDRKGLLKVDAVDEELCQGARGAVGASAQKESWVRDLALWGLWEILGRPTTSYGFESCLWFGRFAFLTSARPPRSDGCGVPKEPMHRLSPKPWPEPNCRSKPQQPKPLNPEPASKKKRPES